MWLEIDGVMHTDLEAVAVKFGYNVEHLRRLAKSHSIHAIKRGHFWWTTDDAILRYRAGGSRRKPRAEAGRRREGKANKA